MQIVLVVFLRSSPSFFIGQVSCQVIPKSEITDLTLEIEVQQSMLASCDPSSFLPPLGSDLENYSSPFSSF